MKRRFVFRLERVLEERRRAERRQQHELAVLVATLSSRKERHRKVVDRAEALQNAMGDWLAGSSCSVHDLLLARGEIDAHLEQADELEREVRWLNDATDRQRLRLQDLARQRLLLERLRERAYAEYLAETRRIEAAQLDDFRRQDLATAWGSRR
jgi:flagellar FliJ protein